MVSSSSRMTNNTIERDEDDFGMVTIDPPGRGGERRSSAPPSFGRVCAGGSTRAGDGHVGIGTDAGKAKVEVKVPTVVTVEPDEHPSIISATPTSAEEEEEAENRRRLYARTRRESPVQSHLWRAHEAGISTNGTVLLSESFLRRNRAGVVGFGGRIPLAPLPLETLRRIRPAGNGGGGKRARSDNHANGHRAAIAPSSLPPRATSAGRRRSRSLLLLPTAPLTTHREDEPSTVYPSPLGGFDRGWERTRVQDHVHAGDAGRSSSPVGVETHEDGSTAAAEATEADSPTGASNNHDRFFYITIHRANPIRSSSITSAASSLTEFSSSAYSIGAFPPAYDDHDDDHHDFESMGATEVHSYAPSLSTFDSAGVRDPSATIDRSCSVGSASASASASTWGGRQQRQQASSLSLTSRRRGAYDRLRSVAARAASFTSWYSGGGVELVPRGGDGGGGRVDGSGVWGGDVPRSGSPFVVTPGPDGGEEADPIEELRTNAIALFRDSAGSVGGSAGAVDWPTRTTPDEGRDDDSEAADAGMTDSVVIALPRSRTWDESDGHLLASSRNGFGRDEADGSSAGGGRTLELSPSTLGGTTCLSCDDLEMFLDGDRRGVFFDVLPLLNNASASANARRRESSTSTPRVTTAGGRGVARCAARGEEKKDDDGSVVMERGDLGWEILAGGDAGGGGGPFPCLPFDPWGTHRVGDENGPPGNNYYYGGGGYDDDHPDDSDSSPRPLPFKILGTSADDVSCHPHVLSPPLMESLRAFLPPSVSDCSNFWLKYSLVRDGSSLQTLLRNVRASTHTILAVETVDGDVLGSFTSSPWRRSGGRYYGTGESFLWRMQRPRTVSCRSVIDQAQREGELDVYPWTGRNEYVQLCTGDKLALGGGALLGGTAERGSGEDDVTDDNDGGGFGLVLDRHLLFGASRPCATFANPSLAQRGDDGGRPFEILNVEVWALTPFSTVQEAETMEATKIFLEENRV